MSVNANDETLNLHVSKPDRRLLILHSFIPALLYARHYGEPWGYLDEQNTSSVSRRTVTAEEDRLVTPTEFGQTMEIRDPNGNMMLGFVSQPDSYNYNPQIIIVTLRMWNF
jgi:hypothetical protein